MGWNPDRISLSIQNFGTTRLMVSDSPCDTATNGKVLDPFTEFSVTLVDGGRPELRYFCCSQSGTGAIRVFEDFRRPALVGDRS